MSYKSPEQRLEDELNSISSYRFYSKVLKQIEPKTVPFRFVSHVVAHLKNGEEILINKDMLLDPTRVYCTSNKSAILGEADKITHTRTYVDIAELSKKVEEDLEELYKGHF